MKGGTAFLCTLVLMTAAVAGTQTRDSRTPAKATDDATIAGVWRAEADGLPFVTLTLTNETGRLEGAVLFYLHRREEGKPVTSTPGIPEPLFDMSFDGKVLAFQVSHRHAHPPGTLPDPPVTFRLKLTGVNTGELTMGEVDPDKPRPGMTLTRADY